METQPFQEVIETVVVATLNGKKGRELGTFLTMRSAAYAKSERHGNGKSVATRYAELIAMQF
jgi:hypothetical protein